MSGSSAVLAAEGVHAGYGDVSVVRDLSLSIEPGEIVALLGPNGAGKSTTLMTLAGAIAPSQGAVLWRGRVTSAPLHRRVRMGMAVVPETRGVFMNLTVSANLRLGAGDPRAALELFPELAPLSDRRVGLLSGGEQQILTLARALASAPAMLLVDELSLGLAPLVVERLLAALIDAAGRGVSVLLVEQHARQALGIADRALVLRRGEIALQGGAGDIGSRLGEIESSYLAAAERRS